MFSWLGPVGGAIGILVFLGAVVVYLRGSADKGTIETLERSNKALLERVDMLEKNETRMVVRIETLEKENARLEAQRPSADAIASLGEVAKATHEMLAQHDRDIKAILSGGN